MAYGVPRITRRNPAAPRTSRISCPTSSSRPWIATGIGHWSRSTSPPAPAPPSCSASARARGARGPGGRWSARAAGAATVARLGGRVRVAPALPAGDSGPGPEGAREALWWTLRRPFRPLTYDATRMVFNQANAALGANWTLHDLRHSAAKRMVRDPDLTLADVQWVPGTPTSPPRRSTASTPDEVIAHVLAHHERQRTERGQPPAPPRLATGPRCWRRCSAPRPPTERPDDRRAAGLTVAETSATEPGHPAEWSRGHPRRLVADPPTPGGADRAAAWLVHRPERGPRPRQDPAARSEQAAGLAPAPAWGHLAGTVAGQRRGHRWVRVG